MTGGSGADQFVVRVRFAAAGITRNCFRDALQGIEDCLDSPEASAGENRGFKLLLGFFVDRRIRQIRGAQERDRKETKQTKTEEVLHSCLLELGRNHNTFLGVYTVQGSV